MFRTDILLVKLIVWTVNTGALPAFVSSCTALDESLINLFLAQFFRSSRSPYCWLTSHLFIILGINNLSP